MLEEIMQIPIKPVLDDRGILRAIEYFPEDVKRAYMIQNYNNDVVRAFHGHRFEKKWLFVIQGDIQLCTLKIEDYENKDLLYPDYVTTQYFGSIFLNQLIEIPAGYFQGWKALTNDTIVMFLSNKTVEESKTDDIRLPWDIFGKELWNAENR